ncbi:hypothetical protein ACJX0J_038140, partial [Zea mays]
TASLIWYGLTIVYSPNSQVHAYLSEKMEKLDIGHTALLHNIKHLGKKIIIIFSCNKIDSFKGFFPHKLLQYHQCYTHMLEGYQDRHIHMSLMAYKTILCIWILIMNIFIYYGDEIFANLRVKRKKIA